MARCKTFLQGERLTRRNVAHGLIPWYRSPNGLFRLHVHKLKDALHNIRYSILPSVSIYWRVSTLVLSSVGVINIAEDAVCNREPNFGSGVASGAEAVFMRKVEMGERARPIKSGAHRLSRVCKKVRCK